MRKSKILIAAEARIAALEAQVLALEAKLSLGRTLYVALRDSVRSVEHAAPAAPRTTCAAPRAAGLGAMPVVTRYQDALGRTWIKTRTGNRASSRLADAPIDDCDASRHGAEHDERAAERAINSVAA